MPKKPTPRIDQPQSSELLSRIFQKLDGICLSMVRRIGVAYSGGLDSTVLLHSTAAWSRKQKSNFDIFALHINHQLRPSAELILEERLVIENCIACKIPIILIDLGEQEIRQLMISKKIGVEEAARQARYQALETVGSRLALDCILTAHHQDDSVEWQMMRFFQGQGPGRTIPAIRGKYWRPMLECTRADLQVIARDCVLSWHEDSTNATGKYLRNRVRTELLPIVHNIFPGHNRALVAWQAFSAMDEAYLESEAEFLPWQRELVQGGSKHQWMADAEAFFRLSPAVRWRAVRQCCIQLLQAGEIERLPERNFYQVILALSVTNQRSGVLVASEKIQFGRQGTKVFVRPHIVECLKKGYLVSLTKVGSFCLPFLGTVEVTESGAGVGACALSLQLRALRPCDCLPKTGQNLWHFLKKKGLLTQNLSMVPVVVESGRIVAILSGTWIGIDIWLEPKRYRVKIQDLELHR